ncbi:hypothetical protein EC396_14220 [Lutibacter sp. HS1-25]|uniref:hypothetical protein n=1 Tax=Lutibacter sp. HS1-25 TaxID=2485000 RepID=UPI00101049B1|nr:hypothetical protein [Lutibacter sp. HS1-25]RXP46369.1 hypothetical protein EC396_14220 [Lutibacter sp. HS1-25]
MIKRLSILMFLIALCSCKTVTINEQTQQVAISPVELLTIGVEENNLQTISFETTAIPILNNKIRVHAMLMPFNKTTYKAYSSAVNSQGGENSIKYVDSLPNKPHYITLKVADNVAFLKELNGEYNTAEVQYLKTMNKAKLVTAVSMVFNEQLMKEIEQADELYLKNEKYKKYDLELYKNNVLVQEIELTGGVTFAYKLAAFCWGKNAKRQTAILNIIDEHSKCTKPTYDNFQKSEEKNAFKF